MKTRTYEAFGPVPIQVMVTDMGKRYAVRDADTGRFVQFSNRYGVWKHDASKHKLQVADSGNDLRKLMDAHKLTRLVFKCSFGEGK